MSMVGLFYILFRTCLLWGLVLVGNAFELIVQPLAHCAISHFFVPFDAVLQFSSCFYYVFHNLQLLCSPRFGATVLINFSNTIQR